LHELLLIISFQNPELAGVYHVSSDPISKYDLLKLVARKYDKKIEIEPYDDFRQDRSLDSSLFRRLTGYMPPSWPELVDKMHQDFISLPQNILSIIGEV